jgi:hypothetical protein
MNNLAASCEESNNLSTVLDPPGLTAIPIVKVGAVLTPLNPPLYAIERRKPQRGGGEFEKCYPGAELRGILSIKKLRRIQFNRYP